MSAITPQTELKLLKCPIESDSLNQIFAIFYFALQFDNL